MSEFIRIPDHPDEIYVRSIDVVRAIDDAKEVLQTSRNISLATVNANGLPHNTVLGPAFERTSRTNLMPDMYARFWSYPNTRHVANIRRTGWAAIQVFNSHVSVGSLLIDATVRELSLGEVAIELEKLNAIRLSYGEVELAIEEFDPEYCWPRFPAKALYIATPRRMSVPVNGYFPSGKFAGNFHYPVTPRDLDRWMWE